VKSAGGLEPTSRQTGAMGRRCLKNPPSAPSSFDSTAGLRVFFSVRLFTSIRSISGEIRRAGLVHTQARHTRNFTGGISIPAFCGESGPGARSTKEGVEEFSARLGRSCTNLSAADYPGIRAHLTPRERRCSPVRAVHGKALIRQVDGAISWDRGKP